MVKKGDHYEQDYCLSNNSMIEFFSLDAAYTTETFATIETKQPTHDIELLELNKKLNF